MTDLRQSAAVPPGFVHFAYMDACEGSAVHLARKSISKSGKYTGFCWETSVFLQFHGKSRSGKPRKTRFNIPGLSLEFRIFRNRGNRLFFRASKIRFFVPRKIGVLGDFPDFRCEGQNGSFRPNGVAKLLPEADWRQSCLPIVTEVDWGCKSAPEVDWCCETAFQLLLTGTHPCNDSSQRRLQVTERVLGVWLLASFAFGSGLCVCTCWVTFGFVKSAALVLAFQARIGCWSLDLLSLAACFAFERVSHTLVDLSLYLCLVCSMRTLCADAFCEWQGCCKPLSTADGTQKPGWSCQ